MMALRGAGDSMTPLWFMIVAVVLDSGLNPVFIRGLGPAPRLGIAGSATATADRQLRQPHRAAHLHLRAGPAAAAARRASCAICCPTRRMLKTIVVKGLPMGLQMIVISLVGLALIGLVNREGVDTDRGLRRRDAALDLCPDAGDGARRRGQRDGRAEYRRRQVGPGQRGSPASAIVQSLLITGALIVAADVRRPAGARPVHGPDSPALPIARHIQLLATWNFLLFGVTMVLFGTVRANGAVWAPLIILAIGLCPVRFGSSSATYGWLGADAIWMSFPVSPSSTSRLPPLSICSGGWKKARMTVRSMPRRARVHARKRSATREPGGALNPAG